MIIATEADALSRNVLPRRWWTTSLREMTGPLQQHLTKLYLYVQTWTSKLSWWCPKSLRPVGRPQRNGETQYHSASGFLWMRMIEERKEWKIAVNWQVSAIIRRATHRWWWWCIHRWRSWKNIDSVHVCKYIYAIRPNYFSHLQIPLSLLNKM